MEMSNLVANSIQNSLQEICQISDKVWALLDSLMISNFYAFCILKLLFSFGAFIVDVTNDYMPVE